MPEVMTLDDVINLDERYDVSKISFYTTIDSEDGTSLVIPTNNLFRDYYKYLNQFVHRYYLTDRQRRIYRCRPFLLSNAIYDTPNLAWLIMMLNNQESPSKFRLKQYINLISSDDLSNIYDSIVTKAKDKMERNWLKTIYKD